MEDVIHSIQRIPSTPHGGDEKSLTLLAAKKEESPPAATDSDTSGISEVDVREPYLSYRKAIRKMENSRTRQDCNEIAGSPGSQLKCFICGSNGHLVPRCRMRHTFAMRSKTAAMEKKGEEMGKDDPKPTLSVAGAIGAVCAVSAKQFPMMVVDAAATSALISKPWLYTQCE